MKPYYGIGENIHCTRALKRNGSFVDETRNAIRCEIDGRTSMLPIPDAFLSGSDWESGKVRHCAVAVWQGLYGTGDAQRAGVAYLQNIARLQEKHGSVFLDINVDEFGADVEERIRAMRWTVGIIQQATSLPLSIDTSQPDLMRAGLAACDRAHGRPMINSISLERLSLVPIAAEHKAAVVASAAGAKSLPVTTEERLANLQQLIDRLEAAGIERDWIYVDPLVYTISTDPANGKLFLEAVTAIRRHFGEAIHIGGGVSNVSFGLPCRKLINQVFAWLMVEAGADSGIVDPAQINSAILQRLDPASEPFQLARALIIGEDEFGANFIGAFRDGRIS